jgi:hypothetical protein
MAEPNSPESAPDAPALPLADETGSLADHEAQYREGGRSEPVHREASTEPATPPAETPERDSEPPLESTEPEAEAERDERGRFLKRTPAQRRSPSHTASPEDVPRIARLTAQLRAAEAERDALRAQTSRPPGATEVSTTRQPAVPPPPSPKPTPDQFDDYGAYVEALTDWKTDQKFQAAEQQRQQRERQRTADAERQRLTTSWKQRVDAAKSRYPDFTEVALESDTPIPPGSLIDAWILEHKTGADVLYYLQSHPDEIARLLEQPVLDQAESLALLSQRFTGTNGRGRAADTGSAPASVSTPPPKPPNPVRTGPMRAGDEPPDPEQSSLADHEKYYRPRKQRGA